LKTLFYILVFIIYSSVAAQSYKSQYNHIGLQGQYVFLNINTSNFNMEQGSGFLAGLSQRGAYFNNFDLIYGVDFIQASSKLRTRDLTNKAQEVNFTTTGAQIKLLLSYLILAENLTVEFGPVLQINSALKLQNEDQKRYIIEGYDSLRAEDIQEWSRLNGMILGGFSAGIDNVRFIARYQYGVTNALKKLNKENLENKDPAAINFKGNLSLITAGIVFYL